MKLKYVSTVIIQKGKETTCLGRNILCKLMMKIKEWSEEMLKGYGPNNITMGLGVVSSK